MRRSRRPSRYEREDEARVNHGIRAPRVLVIDDQGEKLGEFLTKDAIELASSRGLDLIEVASNARPPVCRIADYGRLKYEKKKKDAIARKKQAVVSVKEVKIRPKTDEHDYQVKLKGTRKFLAAGDKVKVTVRFRGREHAHRDIGVARCEELANAVEDLAVIEAPARMDGRQMVMILAPRKR
ncbi:MAG: translation initiation factor IF-3 [Myxococcota bacterium]|nr:translation initiation factor IF-3 [Myxococcota bacterium]